MDAAKTSENKEEKSALDIFVFSNGQQYTPPRKYHLKAEELKYWDATLGLLARLQYGSLHTCVDLYTIDGRKIQSADELRNFAVYVAVEPPDSFIQAGYDKYLLKASRSWEKRQAKKINTVDATNPDEILAKQELFASDTLKDIINVPTMGHGITETIVANRVETGTHKTRLLGDLKKIQKPISPRVADKKSPVRNLASQRPHVPRKVSANASPETIVKKPVVNRREPPRTSAYTHVRPRIPVPIPKTDINKTVEDVKFPPKPVHVPPITQKVSKIKKPLTSSKPSSNGSTTKNDGKTEPSKKSLSNGSDDLKIDKLNENNISNVKFEEESEKIDSKTTLPKVEVEISTNVELDKIGEFIDVFQHSSTGNNNDKSLLIKINSNTTQNTTNLQDIPFPTKSLYEVPLHEGNIAEVERVFNEVPPDREERDVIPNTLNNIILESDNTNRKSSETSNNELLRTISDDTKNNDMAPLIIPMNKPLDSDLISAAIEASIEKTKTKDESLVKTTSPATDKVSVIDNRNILKNDKDDPKLTKLYRNNAREPESSYNKETDISLNNEQHEDQSYFESSFGTSQTPSLFNNRALNVTSESVPPDDLHSIKLAATSDKAYGLADDVLMIPTPDSKSTPLTEHTVLATSAPDKNANQIVTVLENGDIINLKLDIEVRNANGILKTSQKINTRKSQSSTDIKNDTNDDKNKMLTQSKSLQSVTNECPPHPCCRKEQKIVVQCPCCDFCTLEGTKSNMNAKHRFPAMPPYYVLLPVMTNNDKECQKQCQMCSTSAEKQVQNSESLHQVDIVVATVIDTPLEDDRQSCCSHPAPERPVSFIEKRSQLVIVTPQPSLKSAQVCTSRLGPDACFCDKESPACTLEQTFVDQFTQTDWCDVLLEARPHPDGHFTFHLPPLKTLRQYEH